MPLGTPVWELSLWGGRGLLQTPPMSFPKWDLHLLEGKKKLHRAQDGPHPTCGVALGIFKVLVSQGGQVTYPGVWASNGRRGSSPLQPFLVSWQVPLHHAWGFLWVKVLVGASVVGGRVMCAGKMPCLGLLLESTWTNSSGDKPPFLKSSCFAIHCRADPSPKGHFPCSLPMPNTCSYSAWLLMWAKPPSTFFQFIFGKHLA